MMEGAVSIALNRPNLAGWCRSLSSGRNLLPRS